MQITYAPKAWAVEKASWKAVIQLNLIRSVNVIIDALSASLTPTPSPSTRSRVASPPPEPPSDDDPFTSTAGTVQVPSDQRSHLLKLSLRLAPLRQVEIDLKARLGDGTNEITEVDAAFQAMTASPFDDPPQKISPRPSKEFTVRSHQAWKRKEKERKEKDRASFRPSAGGAGDSDRDITSEVLAGCAEDMIALWEHHIVREVVEHGGADKMLGDSAE